MFERNVEEKIMDDAMLRNVQLIQLEIAKEVKRICEQNNISYFMDGGALLGAVRHKGFIPWDDDLDFGFTRENLLLQPRKICHPNFSCKLGIPIKSMDMLLQKYERKEQFIKRELLRTVMQTVEFLLIYFLTIIYQMTKIKEENLLQN